MNPPQRKKGGLLLTQKLRVFARAAARAMPDYREI